MTAKSTFRASSTQQGLTENMQILTGQKGDRLDKALTLREAAAIGLLNLRRNSSGSVVPETPPGKPSDPEWSGVQMPVAPTGVTADGAFHTITLTWDQPGYKGHSYAEVLRGDEDNPATAVVVGTTLANVYADSVGKGFAAFYWVRFVNKNGKVGPLNGTSGLKASTSPDVDDIIASADHFAIYNPAKPGQKEIIFGVTDDGKVAIREAVIKAATIQIIHSEKITADYIKAGVSISAPLITGGSIDMGNAYLSGGAAGFGKGGPYASWGQGWHTMIYADGSLYTNILRAEGGYVKNMAINNCTISGDCDVKGTIYANKIVGDVVATKSLRGDKVIDGGPKSKKFDIKIKGSQITRVIVISDVEYGVKADSLYSGGIRCWLRAYRNDVLFYTGQEHQLNQKGGGYTGSIDQVVFDIPSGADTKFTIECFSDIASEHTSNTIIKTYNAVAMVMKKGSETFL